MEWEWILGKSNYWAAIILMMIGLQAMISKNNLIKKLIGMSIFQSSIILFYVSAGAKRDSGIPIIHHGPGHGDDHGKEAAHAVAEHATEHAGEAAHHAGEVAHKAVEAAKHAVETADYSNPLPHVLMLTAIVVGVATLGLALAMVQRVHAAYGSIEEDEVLAAIAAETAPPEAPEPKAPPTGSSPEGTPAAS